MKRVMKSKVVIIIALIIMCGITSCSNEPNEPAIEINHTRNQLFDITFVGCSKSNKGISVLEREVEASPGCVFQVVTLSVKNVSNGVEYFMNDIQTITLTLTNGHKYYGYCKYSKLMPDATDTIKVFFETSETESINSATIEFSWPYTDSDKCAMILPEVKSILKPSDISGMYSLFNTSTLRWEGHCCFKEDGTYWQVKAGIESNGSWFFTGERGINVILNEQSKVYEFVSSDQEQALYFQDAKYYSALKLSSSVYYHYGFYDGTELQINNLMVGIWRNYENAIGLTFNKDKTVEIYKYESGTDSWDLQLICSWSYSNGYIRIYGSSIDVYYTVASTDRELYLCSLVLTKYK